MCLEHLCQQAVYSGSPPAPSFLFALVGYLALGHRTPEEELHKFCVSGKIRATSARTTSAISRQQFPHAPNFNPFYLPLFSIGAQHTQASANKLGLLYWLSGALIIAGNYSDCTYLDATHQSVDSDYHFRQGKEYHLPTNLDSVMQILRTAFSMDSTQSLSEMVAVRKIALQQAYQSFCQCPQSGLSAFVYYWLASLPSMGIYLREDGMQDKRVDAEKLLIECDKECIELFAQLLDHNYEIFSTVYRQLMEKPDYEILVKNLVLFLAILIPAKRLPNLADSVRQPALFEHSQRPSRTVCLTTARTASPNSAYGSLASLNSFGSDSFGSTRSG